YPGEDLSLAIAGFLLTRVGLPLLPIIALAFTRTGAKGLPDKPHPTFPTIFTLIVCLSIPPFFPIPPTPTVSYHIPLPPFLSQPHSQSSIPLFFFSIP
ncbi:branched-chain amino acid transport system II carrier protein, partial [Bacillus sp. WP8]|uniref:branched-chain amino acid transport system II carrier protein n=1 Tax=Bacillus sp. WP8 TaxID=756828 RepID=UPI00164241D8